MTTELNDRIQVLADRAELLRREIAAENVKRDHRILMNRIVVTVVGAFAFIGLGVGVSGRQSADTAESALRQANVIVVTSRKSSCDQYNAQQDAGIRSDTAIISTLVNSAQHQTAEQRAQIAAFVAAEAKTIAAGHPHRDCSPAGIAAYLKLPLP